MELTLLQKLKYIEKHLTNNENLVMGIKRIGPGAFQIGSPNTMLLHTGVGGCYDYIIHFADNIRAAHEEYWKDEPGLIKQVEEVEKGKTYPELTLEMIEKAVKEALFGDDKK